MAYGHMRRLGAGLAILLLAGLGRTAAHAAQWSLPEPAMRALKAHFPEATITGVGRERERGAWYYEVTLRAGGGRRFEVEVTEDGVIGEIEAVVKLGDLPEELVKTVRERVGNGRVTRVEKHERRGIARNGKFVPLETPRTSYEVTYVDAAGRRRQFQVMSNQILELPEEVRRQLAGRFPGARIAEAEAEDDEGIIIHAVTLKRNGEEFEVDLLPDGRILELETPVEPGAMPKAALAAVQADKEVRKSDAQKLYRREVFFTVEKGKLVERRDMTYVVRVFRKDAEREYRFDGRGKLLNRPAWEEKAREETEDDEDEEEDD